MSKATPKAREGLSNLMQATDRQVKKMRHDIRRRAIARHYEAVNEVSFYLRDAIREHHAYQRLEEEDLYS